MSESNSKLFFCSLAIVILFLVPLLQIIPLKAIQLPSASATSGVTINNNQTTSGSGKSSATIPNFVASTGTNRLLLVGIEADNKNATSVTFGSAKLTEAVGSFHFFYTSFYYLKNPNGTANINVTFAGNTGFVVGAYALSGVDQANPIPTTATNSNGVNPYIPLNTEFSNSRVTDSVSAQTGTTLSSPTCMKYWNIIVTSHITGASSSNQTTTPGYVNCSWHSSLSGGGWDDAAIEIKANGTSAPITPIMLNGKSTASNGAGTSVTIYNFKPGTGSNRLLLVGVETQSQNVTATSIKFGSAALTKAISSSSKRDTEFWYLTNPSSTPANLTATFNGSRAFVVGAYAFSGVNQTNPIATTAKSNGTGNIAITIPTKYPSSWVLDSPAIFGDVTLSNPTCTQQWNLERAGQVTGASSSNQTTPGNVTCRWTNSISGDKWDDVAVELRAAAPAKPTINVFNPFSYSAPNPPSSQPTKFYTVGPFNETGFFANESVVTHYVFPNGNCTVTYTANSNGKVYQGNPTGCAQGSANYTGGYTGNGTNEGTAYDVNATGQTSHLSTVTTFVPTLTNGSNWLAGSTSSAPKVISSTLHLFYFNPIENSTYTSIIKKHNATSNFNQISGFDYAASFRTANLDQYPTNLNKILLEYNDTNSTFLNGILQGLSNKSYSWVGYDDECGNNNLSTPNIEIKTQSLWIGGAESPCSTYAGYSTLNATAIVYYTNDAATRVHQTAHENFVWAGQIDAVNATFPNGTCCAYKKANWNNIDALVLQLQDSKYSDHVPQFNKTLALISGTVKSQHASTLIFAQVNPSGSVPCNCPMGQLVYDLQYSRFHASTPTNWLYDGVGMVINTTPPSRVDTFNTYLGR
jgi:hypothetical protein